MLLNASGSHLKILEFRRNVVRESTIYSPDSCQIQISWAGLSVVRVKVTT